MKRHAVLLLPLLIIVVPTMLAAPAFAQTRSHPALDLSQVKVPLGAPELGQCIVVNPLHYGLTRVICNGGAVQAVLDVEPQLPLIVGMAVFGKDGGLTEFWHDLKFPKTGRVSGDYAKVTPHEFMRMLGEGADVRHREWEENLARAKKNGHRPASE